MSACSRWYARLASMKSLQQLLLCLAAVVSAEGADPARFDIEGIHLGMPLKEAMAALRVHNANLKLVPDSVPYDGLPSALTYGISAVGGGEGIQARLVAANSQESEPWQVLNRGNRLQAVSLEIKGHNVGRAGERADIAIAIQPKTEESQPRQA